MLIRINRDHWDHWYLSDNPRTGSDTIKIPKYLYEEYLKAVADFMEVRHKIKKHCDKTGQKNKMRWKPHHSPGE